MSRSVRVRRGDSIVFELIKLFERGHDDTPACLVFVTAVRERRGESDGIVQPSWPLYFGHDSCEN
ncbi:uncharacterized protein STEHIDRAFT_143471 [Stereum hirsutum FP-91666 SS1]|uniref:uncharacterized protein n=1 Tax=Stereum hirsutum (strain FP-91666) TaxID=721885 RepID=UPI000440A0AB|nr:uncharacterized protein STEHIDRAFT_143471 [Stereum hirsutum FP-91666 SS1]EIM91987.1 hypothetical protein STEHIDRAFT_143471 [Stereum hirsutum FP-91666 SS1]